MEGVSDLGVLEVRTDRTWWDVHGWRFVAVVASVATVVSTTVTVVGVGLLGFGGVGMSVVSGVLSSMSAVVAGGLDMRGRMRRRLERGRCPACGFDLSAHEAARVRVCTECGSEIEMEEGAVFPLGAGGGGTR